MRDAGPNGLSMDAKYEAYLLSPEWKAKREQRLTISNHSCSACTASRNVHVHHLTYERIFNENMEDLLPLCEEHHNRIELLIRSGEMSRKGHPLFLASETIRLLMQQGTIRRNGPAIEPSGQSIVARNPYQQGLLKDCVFVVALKSMSRKQFRNWFRKKYGKTSRICTLSANAFALYDRYHRTIRRDARKSHHA